MTTIAVVEDNPTVRQTLQEWIDSAPGCRCVCACATCKAALADIPHHHPDVVLLDIRMPEGDGLTALGRIKLDKPDMPVLMLSTFDNPTYIARSVALGANGARALGPVGAAVLYTLLGGFRAVPRAQFKPRNIAPNVLGTRCHMLGMYVCFDNPTPMVADYPTAYEGQPGFDFPCVYRALL